MKRANIKVLQQSHLKLSKLAAFQYYYQRVIVDGIKHSLCFRVHFKMSSSSDISSPSDVSSEGEDDDMEGVGVGTDPDNSYQEGGVEAESEVEKEVEQTLVGEELPHEQTEEEPR